MRCKCQFIAMNRLWGALHGALEYHNQQVRPSFICILKVALICSFENHGDSIRTASLKLLFWDMANNMTNMFALRPALKCDRNGKCCGKISLNPRTLGYQIKVSTTVAPLVVGKKVAFTLPPPLQQPPPPPPPPPQPPPPSSPR